MEQIRNRFTGKVMLGGLSLKVVIEKHHKYLRGEEGGCAANLSAANLSDADLRCANLSAANLSAANLSAANLRCADLSAANLSAANLSAANLMGVPFIDNIHQKVYEAASKEGALDMGHWHVCETTHCRAGWVVHLAGEAGKAMEFCIGTPAAAAMIYLKSDPKLGLMPDFYCTNSEALADMKARAEKEAANNLTTKGE